MLPPYSSIALFAESLAAYKRRKISKLCQASFCVMTLSTSSGRNETADDSLISLESCFRSSSVYQEMRFSELQQQQDCSRLSNIMRVPV